MKSPKLILLAALMALAGGVQAQNQGPQNTAASILASNESLSIRGYSELVYNQQFSTTARYNGKLDAKRFVLFAGYKFDSKTSFVTEMEVEHGNEIYLEQAFLQHKLATNINLRAGVLLIPMGIVNEYHEPTTFNGVERPNVDKYILPTTWRELGMGLQGVVPDANLRYQLYVVNGLKSHDGTNGLFNEVKGMRSGRQKAIKSTISSPNFTGKLDYIGVRNLTLGASFYSGRSQSTLYNGVANTDAASLATADSSAVYMNIVGLDARYQKGALQLRGQLVYNSLSGVAAYNAFTGSELGAAMWGGYAEVAYQILPASSTYKLLPFIRVEAYDTQVNAAVDNVDSDRTEITTGLTWHMSPGAVLKADYQLLTQGAATKNQFNLGVGVWF